MTNWSYIIDKIQKHAILLLLIISAAMLLLCYYSFWFIKYVYCNDSSSYSLWNK